MAFFYFHNMHYVYILFSQKLNKFYIGYTADLNQRMQYHQMALKGKFTAAANDWEVYITIECSSKKQALAIERHIKHMKSKKYIQNLKQFPEMKEKLLLRY